MTVPTRLPIRAEPSPTKGATAGAGPPVALPPVLARSVAGARRRLWLQVVLDRALAGAAAGGLAALGLMLAARLWPLLAREPLLLGLAGLVAGGLLVGAAAGLWRRPPAVTAARALDARLALAERVATAVELSRSTPTSLAARQIADAGAALTRRDWGRAFRPRLSWRRFGAAAGPAALAGALLLLPNPQLAVLEERAATRAALEAAAREVTAARQRLQSHAELDAARRAESAQALQALEEALRSGQLDRRQALSQIAAAETAIRAADAQTAGRAQALGRLAEEFQTSGATAPAGAALAAGDPAAAAAALDDLARRLGELDAGQGQALADKLDRAAASQAVANPALAGSLAGAAAALRAGDAGAAGSDLAQAAGQLQTEAQAQAAARAAGAAQQSLARARQQVATAGGAAARSFNDGGQSAQPGAASGTTGTPGAGGQPAGAGDSQGDASGRSAGSQGAAGGQGAAGAGQGRVAGATSPRTEGGTAGAGQPVLDRAGSTGVGGHEPVYAPLPAAASSGPADRVAGQDRGAGASDSQPAAAAGGRTEPLVPYSQVYGQYRAQATGALEDGSIPPALRDYVRDYFTGLDSPAP